MPYPTQKDTINSGKNAATFSGGKKNQKGGKEGFMLKGEEWKADPADPECVSDSKETPWAAPDI